MNDQPALSKDELLAEAETAFKDFNAYLDSLTEQQLTGPTDAAGWTSKDHVIHLAVWLDSVSKMIEKKPRWEAMGVSKELWDYTAQTYDYDPINGDIQQRYRDRSLQDVRAAFNQAHQELMGKIRAMSQEDLERPGSYYQTGSTSTRPLIDYIVGDTTEHYPEHQAYIEAIVSKS